MKDWNLENYNKIGKQGRIGAQGLMGEIGPQGAQGMKGDYGYAVEIKLTHSVSIYCPSEEKPETPVGGGFNFCTNEVMLPDGGWYLQFPDDNSLPIYSSIGSFSSSTTDDEYSEPIEWTEPVLESGIKGEDSDELEYIYCRNNIENFSKVPESVNIKGDVPNGYTNHVKGVDETHIFEWEYKRILKDDVWGVWNGPTLHSQYGRTGEDGDGIEYIFYLSATKDGKPVSPNEKLDDDKYYDKANRSQSSDYVPTELGWTDNPVTLDGTQKTSDGKDIYRYQWVSKRKRNSIPLYDDLGNFMYYTYRWEKFSDPSLWNMYVSDAENGIKLNILNNGETFDSYEEFKNKILDNIVVSGDSSYIGDHLLEYGDCYMVNGFCYVFVGTGENWLKMSLKFDGTDIYIHQKYAQTLEYLNGVTLTERQKCFTDAADGKEIGESSAGAKYMGTYADGEIKDSVDPKDYEWSLFVGSDGFGIEYIYYRTKEKTPPLIPTESADEETNPIKSRNWCGEDSNGIVWTDDPLGIDSEYMYEWFCIRYYENSEWGDFKGDTSGYARLYDYYSFTEGEIGRKDGVILYPAGYYDSSVTYKRTKYTAPYVMYNEKFYYLSLGKEEGEIKGEDPESSLETSDGVWEPMDSVTAIFTEIIMADSANLGSSVFNGEYIFSQQGENQDGTVINNFELFFKGDPYYEEHTYEYYLENGCEYKATDGETKTIKPTGYFKPNWCVDLKRGRMWANCGRIKTEGSNGMEIMNSDNEKVFYVNDDGDLVIRGTIDKPRYEVDNVSDYDKYFIMGTLKLKSKDGSTETVSNSTYHINWRTLEDCGIDTTKETLEEYSKNAIVLNNYIDYGNVCYNTVLNDIDDTSVTYSVKSVAPIVNKNEENSVQTQDLGSDYLVIPMSFDIRYSNSFVDINKEIGINSIELSEAIDDDNIKTVSVTPSDMVSDAYKYIDSNYGILYVVYLPYVEFDEREKDTEGNEKYLYENMGNVIEVYPTYDDLINYRKDYNDEGKIDYTIWYYDENNEPHTIGRYVYSEGYEKSDLYEKANNPSYRLFMTMSDGKLSRFMTTPTRNNSMDNKMHFATVSELYNRVGETITFRNNTNHPFVFTTSTETLGFNLKSEAEIEEYEKTVSGTDSDKRLKGIRHFCTYSRPLVVPDDKLGINVYTMNTYNDGYYPYLFPAYNKTIDGVKYEGDSRIDTSVTRDGMLDNFAYLRPGEEAMFELKLLVSDDNTNHKEFKMNTVGDGFKTRFKTNSSMHWHLKYHRKVEGDDSIKEYFG